MSQVARKKQLGMYTFALDDDGTLRISAPTLLKPLAIEAKQAQELARWLAEAHQVEITPAPVPEVEPVGAAPQASTTIRPEAEQAAQAPAATVAETAEEKTRRIIQQQVAMAREQYPESLTVEKRDLLIEQITRVAEIRPLLSQGKVSWKQIMLWVNQEIEG